MRINKELRNYVDYNIKELNKSGKKLADIYRIMFRDNGLNIAEAEVDYRIRRYSYAEVRGLIENTSAELYSRLGATHEYVALEMENCVEWIVAFWAILKSGNKPFLVNCRHTTDLSNGILKDLNITTIIGMNSTRLDGSFIDFSEIYAKAKSGDLTSKECPADVFEDEIAISTSATSMHHSVCFYGGAEISQQILDAEKIIEESPRMASLYHGQLKQLAFLPFYHIFGLFAVFFWFGFFGRTFVFLKNLAPDTIAHTCRRHEVTHIFAVPVLWHTVEKKILAEVSRMPEKKQRSFRTGLKICTKLQNISPYLGARISKYIMGEVVDQVFGPSIQFCISGGSYIMDSTLQLFNGIGYPLHNGYGMSEVGITSVELRQKPSSRNLNSVGHPFESIKYRVNDEGQLEVKGTSIARRVMIDGVVQPKDEWFKTMDVVSKDGDYYFIKGRAKDIVIGDNGENINPDLIEKMFSIPYALNFSCVGIPQNEGDELAIVVQLASNSTMEQAQEIHKIVADTNDKLSSSMQIRKFYFTNDPIMASQAIKVSRPYLLKGIKDGSIKLSEMRNYVPHEALSEVEHKSDRQLMDKIKAIVASNLDISADEVDPNANIMLDLGATSLQFFAIVSRINDEYGVESYTCKSVVEFVQYIKGQRV